MLHLGPSRTRKLSATGERMAGTHLAAGYSL
jgi:hypothetical protein